MKQLYSLLSLHSLICGTILVLLPFFAFAAPVAVNDTGTTPVNTPLAGNSVLANDTGGAIRVGTYQSTSSQGGTVTLNTTTGTYTYLPPTGFSGTDTFTYRALDNAAVASNLATVTITVTPRAVNDTGVATAGTSFTGSSVLSNDLGTSLRVLSANVTTNRGGTVTMTLATGVYTYTPPRNYSGPDSFGYTLADQNGNTSSGTVNLSVLPKAGNDTFSVGASTGLYIDKSSLLVNDLGSSLSLVPSSPTSSQGFVVSITTDGASYSPSLFFSGTDSFPYSIRDASGATATATVTITVIPRAVNDSYSVGNGRILNASVGVLNNDRGSNLRVLSNTSTTQGVALTVNPNGTFRYTPPTNYIGTDSFTYTVADGEGSTATATVVITVTGLTATISSSAGASTSSAPIPFSVVFSTAVTDFDATDVTIAGNTGTVVATSFRGSGTTYSFRIQPQDVPLVTVTLSIPAGAAHDAAGNTNPAATFTIQYVRPTTTTRQGTNNDWFNPDSWDNGVPTRNIDAVVPDGLVAYVGSNNAQARSLLVGAGANVLQVGGTMELTGNLLSQGSSSSGTYLQELLLTGPSNQTISNGQALVLSKLTVGPAGATLNSPLTIGRLLTLKGDLTTKQQVLRLATNYSAGSANPALVDNAGGVVQGPVVVERAINGSNQGLGYRHYAPPVTGSTVATLTTATFTPEVSQASVYNASATPGTTVPFPTVYGYDERRLASTTNNLSAFDKGFVVPTDLNAPLVPGQGYAVNIAGTEVVNFVGTLNNGDYPVALTRVAGNADAGWALVGNPYPAILDWDLTTRTGLNDALYVVQSTGQYTGGYSSYVNGVAVNNGSQFVAPGQGFFVRVAEGQPTGRLTFTNAARTVTAAPTAFQRLTQETRPVVRLALTGAGLTDEVVVYAEPGASPAFDRDFDAAKLPNPTGLNLSSATTTTNLAIDGQATFTPATVLALQVGVPAAGTYSLSAPSVANLPTGLDAYLQDAATGQTLKLSPGTSYNFRVTTAEAVALLTGRFTLRFSPAAALAAAQAFTAEAVSVYPNPSHGHFAVVLPGVAGSSQVQADLRNTLGQSVRWQTAPLPASGTTLLLDTAELAPGVYTLRLTAGATVLTKRVVLQ